MKIQKDFHKIWIDQCEAAEGIKERFGVESALRYLIGEKFLNFLEESDRQPGFAEEVPNFVAEVKQMFQPLEIFELLDELKQEEVFEEDEDGSLEDSENDEPRRDSAEEVVKIELVLRAEELLLRQ